MNDCHKMESQPNNAGSLSWLQIVLLGRRPKYTLLRLAVLVLGAIVLFTCVLLPIRVLGQSMMPTYRDGSINFVNRMAYVRHEPRRGDVVAIRYSDVSVMLMKRVVGLPGETIGFFKGQLFVNGEPLPEPYLNNLYRWNYREEKLGPDEYFVVGENRANSELGRVERGRIVGRIVL